MSVSDSDEPVSDGLVTIRLLRAPLAVWTEAEDYYNELVREFQLILLASGEPDGAHLPGELVAMMERLTERFRVATAAPRPERDAAEAAGATHVDVTHHVTHDAAADVAELGRLLRLADDMCRSSKLLTLTASEQTWEFNRWYVEQFVRQGAGQAPSPWTGP